MKPSHVAAAVLLACIPVAHAAVVRPAPKIPPVTTPAKPKPVLRLAPVTPVSNAVPDGSYLRSCRAPRVEQGVLAARCERQRAGEFRDSTIPVARCAGTDIFNSDGMLFCATPVRAHWGDNVVPPGSWLLSCRGLVRHGVLRAACRTGDSSGSGIPLIDPSREIVGGTELDLARCPNGSDIANIRGQLTCIGR